MTSVTPGIDRRRWWLDGHEVHVWKDGAVTEPQTTVRDGDVIEFSLRGVRRTAEVMMVTDDGLVLLDLFDGDRPAFARVSILEDVAVFRVDADDVLAV